MLCVGVIRTAGAAAGAVTERLSAPEHANWPKISLSVVSAAFSGQDSSRERVLAMRTLQRGVGHHRAALTTPARARVDTCTRSARIGIVDQEQRFEYTLCIYACSGLLLPSSGFDICLVRSLIRA